MAKCKDRNVALLLEWAVPCEEDLLEEGPREWDSRPSGVDEIQ